MSGCHSFIINDAEYVVVCGTYVQFAVFGAVPLKFLVGSVINLHAVAVEDRKFQFLDEVALRNVEIVVYSVNVAWSDGVRQV